MKKIIAFALCFLLLMSSVCAYAKYEIPYSGLVDNPAVKELIKEAARSENSDLMYPPESHPYIYVNDEFISHLKENKNSEVYKQAYTYQLSLAKKALPAQPKGGILDVGISNQLMARAFMYLMGEFDTAHARETVDFAIEYVENAQTAKTYSIDIY